MQKKFLVLNFGGIGDQTLFFPVFETLRKTYNNPYIMLVTESRSRAAGDLTNSIDEVFVCDLKGKNKYFELIRLLAKAYKNKYDIVISSGTSQFISILLFLTGIKERIGYDSGRLSRILLTRAVKLNQNQYASNMYHDLVSAEKEDKIPEISPLATLGRNDGVKTIVIHPGVSKLSVQKNIIKCWATDNWVKLIEKLLFTGNYRVLLTGGPDDAEVIEVFKEKFPENIAETRNIKDFVNIVSQSDMLVCVDSAPMHIGVGLRKPVVALFGPTDEKKLLPMNNELFIAIKNDNLDCRPCLWDKRQTSCEKQDCLNISPDEVFARISDYFVQFK